MDSTPPQPQATKPKTQNITAPKLLSKPDLFDSPLPTIGKIKKVTKNQESLSKNTAAGPSFPSQAGTQEACLERPREAAQVPAIFSAGKGSAEVTPSEDDLEGGVAGRGRVRCWEGRPRPRDADGGGAASGEALSGLAHP